MNISGAGNVQGILLQSLGVTQNNQTLADEQIATGNRINQAQNDPAGLSILTSLMSQDQGYEQALTNIQTSAGLTQVGQAAADSITGALQQARDLAVRASDSSYSDADRAAMNQQLQDILGGINQTAAQATFNGVPVLGGNTSLTVQSGPNEGDTSQLNLRQVNASTLFDKPVGELSIGTQQEAQNFIGQADAALNNIGGTNVNLGQFNDSLNRTLDLQRQNLTATQGAASNIGSTDFAQAVTQQVTDRILSQANLAMVSQNNANAQAVLALFGPAK